MPCAGENLRLVMGRLPLPAAVLFVGAQGNRELLCSYVPVSLVEGLQVLQELVRLLLLQTSHLLGCGLPVT